MMMKTLSCLLLLFFLAGLQASAQKTTTLTSNLNSSKSNINRMIYDNSLITPAQAEKLLADAERAGIRDGEKMKQWLASNFKAMGIPSDKISVLDVYVARESSSCPDCRKTCKGRCVWEGTDECRCYYHSEPNLRRTETPQPLLILALKDPSQENQVFTTSGSQGATKSE